MYSKVKMAMQMVSMMCRYTSVLRYLQCGLFSSHVLLRCASSSLLETLAGSAIAGARHIYKWSEEHAPLGRSVHLDDIGGAALYLLSDLSRSVTGEILHVDCGYNIIGMPPPSG